MANDDSTSSGQSASRRVIDVPSTMKSSKYKPQKFGLLFGSIRFFEGLLVGRSNEDKDPYEDINAHHWIPVVDCRKFDETLGALFDFGFDVAMTAALWYDNGKAEKKRWGFPLRIAAILCFAIGGIIPFVVNLFMNCKSDSPSAGCCLMTLNSLLVRRLGLVSTASGTASFPMSCSTAAAQTLCVVSASSPIRRHSKRANRSTRNECAAVYGSLARRVSNRP